MQKFLLRLTLLLSAALLCQCAPSSSNSLQRPLPGNTTIVLLRHCEKDKVTQELTPNGRANAQAIPGALADLKIDAIYCSNKTRNRQTAAPLAKKTGVPVQVLSVPESGFQAQMVTGPLLARHQGKTVVRVGNTWNLEKIYPSLGGSGSPPTDYGDLYILRNASDGTGTVERRTFGN